RHNASWELIDTAGWEHIEEGIGGHAQRLRTDQWQRADLIVLCEPADEPFDSADIVRLREQLQTSGRPLIRVQTNADLASPPHEEKNGRIIAKVSAVTGEGLDALSRTIAAELAGNLAAESLWLGSTAARCADSLAQAIEAIDEALAAEQQELGDELITGELR